MHELAHTIRASTLALIALALASALMVAVLAWRRVNAGAKTRAAIARSTLDVAVVAALLAVLVITFAPTGQYQARQVQLLPLADFASTASARGVLDAAAQAAGNLALFVPLGLIVPVGWPRLDGWASVLGAAAVFSAAIEILQFALGTGHTSSTDDVIWNTLGALLGYALLRAARRIRRRWTSRPAPGWSEASR